MIFTLAGLVVLNNFEFGVVALIATLLATIVADVPRQKDEAWRLLRDVFAGLFSAYALVSILTIARTGALPNLGQLLFFPLLYAHVGLALLPTRTLGLHIVIYLTDVAVVALAVVRTVRGDRGRLLTAMLMWSGIFSLGIGGYYMGRSHPEVLVSMFSAWALALMLLAIATLERVRQSRRRSVTLAQVAVFAGVGVMACSLASTPMPWTQIERLQRTTEPIYVATSSLKRVLKHYSAGNPVAVLNVIGHRAAYEAGIVDTVPYLGLAALSTVQQIQTIVRTLHEAGGTLLALSLGETGTGIYEAFCEAGFRLVAVEKSAGVSLWKVPAPGVAPSRCPVE